MNTVLQNAAVIWFGLGFLFFIMEFIMPGLILFFFGVGAWIVALFLLFVDLSINTQLILFVASSVVTILLFRNWVKKLIWTRKDQTELEDEFIGKTAVAETFIGPGRDGKVTFKGTSWQASSGDVIEPGQSVIIRGNNSIILIVTQNFN